MKDLDRAIASTSAAIAGEDTPEAIKTTISDDPTIIWVRALSGPALSAMIAGIVAVLTWGPAFGAWTATTESQRVQYIGITCLILAGLLGLVFWAIMPGRPNKLEIKAGPASVTLDGGNSK